MAIYAASLRGHDWAAIVEFADYAPNIWGTMQIGGAIQLEGLDRLYYVGDRGQEITLKKISFEAKASSGINPQIVAFERNI